MNLMPLPFEEFEGKGVLDLSSSSCCSPDSLKPSINYKWQIQEAFEEKWWYVQSNCLEPSSVLEHPTRPRSPLSSSSTMSSSQGAFFPPPGSGSDPLQTTTTTPGVSANNPSPVDTQKCGQPQQQQQQQMGVEDWESVLSVGGNNGSSSPGQDHSILRLIMGDVEDPSLGLSKLLQGGVGIGIGPHPELVDFNTTTTAGGGGGGFGLVDQVFNFDPISTPPSGNDPTSLHGDLSSSASPPDFPPPHNPPVTLGRIGSILNQIPNTGPVGFPAGLNPGVFQQPIEDEKPQVFNPLIVNSNQAHFPQNHPAMFLPLPYHQLQEHHHLLSPPPSKRVHLGPAGIQAPFSDSRAELFLQRQQQQQQLQMLQQQQRPPLISNSSNNVVSMKQKFAGVEELGNANSSSGSSQQLQQAIVNSICQAAELIESGDPVLAQGILARLNHQLSLPIGKPSHRAAFYFKEALQLLLHLINTNTLNTNPTNLSPCSLIFKIGAYKSFSEISPILQFANFTCNQALLEAFEGFDRIHVVDFDLGYGGQWASLMQELALRNGGAPLLKITAFASPFSLDELELGFTQENLKIFAREISMPFELEILSLDSLSSGSWPMMPSSRVQDKEVVAVNLPVASFSSFPASLPLVLRLVKQLSPKIVVSLDRACDRFDLPFAHHVNHAIQSYSTLLESLDAVNVNPDALQKIERFLVQPGIEKLVLGRHRCLDRIPAWRNLFSQSGFTPLTFSNFTESQAECLVQRTPVRGFHVEKRQSSLILFWQRKELISASTWRC